jgi:uncharacterized protein (DUF488 family)
MIHTIGHSNHPIDIFVTLLTQHGIEMVADVRSRPYSRFHPQFSRNRLQAELKKCGIEYLFLGEELGARPRDPACYDADGRVSYARIAAGEPFRYGLDRMIAASRTQRVAMMCAEREPLDCHRTLLIARELVLQKIPVVHILADGKGEPHTDTMQRLIKRWRIDTNGLFQDREQLEQLAYELQSGQSAYVRKTEVGKSARTSR